MALRIFGIWTLFVALVISAVAAYYSIIGLVAIFAAATIPIIIMGAALEVGKLTTAVWLHTFWERANWAMKYYLSFALLVLMFITSMGIFGFLSKAHIEQTSASEESVEQVQRVETEIVRLESIITRSEEKIIKLENTGVGADANIQEQIDKEQERIDLAFERINPAIQQQNQIIADAREADADRTKPYEDQLTSIQDQIVRLEDSMREYENTIAGLEIDDSAVQPLLEQIATIRDTISLVNGQMSSGEKEQIAQAQRTVGATPDGSPGPRTRAAVNSWIESRRVDINNLNNQVSVLREEAQKTVQMERFRIGNLIKGIKNEEIPALKERELTMLAKIDEVRQTESPVIQTARDEIQRLRDSAESQVANSQELIEKLRGQLGEIGNTEEIDNAIDELNAKIKESNLEIDKLTEEKYTLQAEYRKLEAEVGPVKYIAEFIYGEADKNILEEAVRWVILILVLVFDPLAVVLVLGGITLIKWRPEGDEPPSPSIKEIDNGPEQDQEKDQEITEEVDESESESDVVEVENKLIESGTEDGIESETTEPTEEAPREVIEKSTEPVKEEVAVIVEEEKPTPPEKRGSFKKDATEFEGLYEDDEGYYTVDATGSRNYSINPEQEKLNRKALKEKQTQEQINKVVKVMKDEGIWPNPPTPTERPTLDQILESDKSGKLEDLLDKADDSTLAQVYQAILSDKSLQQRKSE